MWLRRRQVRPLFKQTRLFARKKKLRRPAMRARAEFRWIYAASAVGVAARRQKSWVAAVGWPFT